MTAGVKPARSLDNQLAEQKLSRRSCLVANIEDVGLAVNASVFSMRRSSAYGHLDATWSTIDGGFHLRRL